MNRILIVSLVALAVAGPSVATVLSPHPPAHAAVAEPCTPPVGGEVVTVAPVCASPLEVPPSLEACSPPVSAGPAEVHPLCTPAAPSVGAGGGLVPLLVEEGGDTMTGTLTMAAGADLACAACIGDSDVDFAYAAAAAKGGKALDADLLDGLDATGFLAADGKAVDADLLDGRDSADFASAGPLNAATTRTLVHEGQTGYLYAIVNGAWTGATWIPMPNMVLNFTSRGGPALLLFEASPCGTVNNIAQWRMQLDGTTVAYAQVEGSATWLGPVSITHLVDLEAGAHALTVEWRHYAACNLYNGPGANHVGTRSLTAIDLAV